MIWNNTKQKVQGLQEFALGTLFLKKGVLNIQFHTVDVFFVWYLLPIPYVRVTCEISPGCSARAFVKDQWFTQSWLLWKTFDDSNNRNKISPERWLKNFSIISYKYYSILYITSLTKSSNLIVILSLNMSLGTVFWAEF